MFLHFSLRISCLAHVKWTGDENLTSHKMHINKFSTLFSAALRIFFIFTESSRLPSTQTQHSKFIPTDFQQLTSFMMSFWSLYVNTRLAVSRLSFSLSPESEATICLQIKIRVFFFLFNISLSTQLISYLKRRRKTNELNEKKRKNIGFRLIGLELRLWNWEEGGSSGELQGEVNFRF